MVTSLLTPFGSRLTFALGFEALSSSPSAAASCRTTLTNAVSSSQYQ